jgi:4'-phosphopantetheinyl transferase EntD
VLTRELGELFPVGVVVGIATPEMWEGPLHPEEETSIRNAVPKRRREFAAGRNCARRALARLGVEDRPLAVGNDREVRWPEGIVGSISHCDDLCAVALARREITAGIGLDVEHGDPLESGLVPLICTPAEQARSKAWPVRSGPPWSKLMFVAKESVYKCVFPLVRAFLDFHDVEVDLRLDSSAFEAVIRHPCAARLGNARLRGRFVATGGHLACGVALPPPGP